jgi:hypothetical protein
MVCNIKAERLAYWYLRLNGFLTIENFILHDEAGGPQRTDVDLIGIRFPHRKEALREYDDRKVWMQDDRPFAEKATPFGAFVEVTTSRCKLNGPWTDKRKGNLPRALRAFGVIPAREIDPVSESLYQTGRYQSDSMELGLISIGREIDPDLTQSKPGVLQIVWEDIKDFIFERFDKYERVKREHPQWDADGHCLWRSFQENRGSKQQFAASLAFV